MLDIICPTISDKTRISGKSQMDRKFFFGSFEPVLIDYLLICSSILSCNFQKMGNTLYLNNSSVRCLPQFRGLCSMMRLSKS